MAVRLSCASTSSPETGARRWEARSQPTDVRSGRTHCFPGGSAAADGPCIDTTAIFMVQVLSPGPITSSLAAGVLLFLFGDPSARFPAVRTRTVATPTDKTTHVSPTSGRPSDANQ